MFRASARTAGPRISRSFSSATAPRAARATPKSFRAAPAASAPRAFSPTPVAPAGSPLASIARPMSSGPAAVPVPGSEITAGDGDFEEILKHAGDKPVVVDFYADWCGPCRMIAPALKKVIAENGKTFLVKVDVDSAEETAAKYEIASLPTVAVFRKMKIVDKFLGTRSEEQIRTFVDHATKEA